MWILLALVNISDGLNQRRPWGGGVTPPRLGQLAHLILSHRVGNLTTFNNILKYYYLFDKNKNINKNHCFSINNILLFLTCEEYVIIIILILSLAVKRDKNRLGMCY